MGRDAETDDAKLASLILVEQTLALYRRARIALVANLVTSALLVVALWPSVSHKTASIWVLVMYLTVGLRFVLVSRHRRAGGETYQARLWKRRWTASTALTGALFGAAGVLLYPPHSLAGQHLLVFVIGGMIAGASSSMSSCLSAFVAFTVPALVPPILRLAVENDRSRWAMAMLLLIFGVGMTALVSEGARALTESIRLRFKNAKLRNDLTEANEQLTRMNTELESRVAVRTEDLQRAMRERDSFVSIVSHELRSPLSSMKLSQEMLQERVERHTLDLPQLQRSFAMLSRQLDRMRRLVDDLFDVTRLSTDQMSYDKEPVELSRIVDDTVEELAAQRLSLVPGLEISVEGGLRGHFDRLRIQQVLVNVILNALKHGAPPYSLVARRISQRAEIVIHDSGPGIPPEQARGIFEAFHRGPSAVASGLGLGLYVSERIVHAHGGIIRVDSPPGGGASFTIELPLIRTAERSGNERR